MSEDPLRKTEGDSSGARIRKNLLNIGIFLAEALLLVFVGPAAVKFFLPVIIGWVIAQIANPLVHFLEKHLHIVRKHSSVGIILGVILLIVFTCYYTVLWVIRQIWGLAKRLPVYYQVLVEGLDKIAENLQGFAERLSPEMRENIAKFTENSIDYLGKMIGNLGGGTVEAAGNAAKNIPSLFISFVFVLLFSYFFIAQSERIRKIARKIFPANFRWYLKTIWKKMKLAVIGYFHAQFKIMGVVGLILAVGFLVIRVEYAVLLAILIAFLDFLPVLGTGTILIPWAVFCALSDAIPRAVGLLILYVVTQVTRQLIQPKMVGDSVGVDTMTALFLLFIGYRISGIVGMIVAIPTGLIIIQFYEAGAFDFVIQNMRELIETINTFRQKPPDSHEM